MVILGLRIDGVQQQTSSTCPVVYPLLLLNISIVDDRNDDSMIFTQVAGGQEGPLTNPDEDI